MFYMLYPVAFMQLLFILTEHFSFLLVFSSLSPSSCASVKPILNVLGSLRFYQVFSFLSFDSLVIFFLSIPEFLVSSFLSVSHLVPFSYPPTHATGHHTS